MSICIQVADLLKRRKSKKQESFETLVRTIATAGDTPPAAEQIAAILEESGKTPAELEREVTRIQGRQKLAQRLAELPDLQAKREEVAAAYKTEQERFAPLVQEHNRTNAALIGRADHLQQQITEAEGARRKLLENYRGPLENELVENRSQQAALNRAVKLMEETAAQHIEAVVYEQARTRGEATNLLDPMVVLSERVVEGKRAAAQSCRETAQKRKEELFAIQAREAEILSEMAKP